MQTVPEVGPEVVREVAPEAARAECPLPVRMPVPNSRPGSGLSSGPERAPGVSQLQQQDSSQRQASQANKNSVVIKVGMVGDAQIGKTSLMVKYVEGSWDEDYIQTLGKLSVCPFSGFSLAN